MSKATYVFKDMIFLTTFVVYYDTTYLIILIAN